jgi:membrane protease YdiL (CAAX protease family)
MPASRQMRLALALGLWLLLTLAATLYAMHLGWGGTALAAALITFSLFLAGEILPAAARVSETVQSVLPAPIAWLLAVPLFVEFAIYALGTGSSSIWRWGVLSAYILVPLALLSLGGASSSGWYDYVALVVIALPVKLRYMNQLWPYPQGQIAHVMSMLLAMNVAIIGFLFVRRLPGVGYSIIWSASVGYAFLAGFVFVAIVDIPAGLALRFLHWAPGHAGWLQFPLTALGIFFFTAWPEEFVFRGLLQNMLSRNFKDEHVGWAVASVLFGLSHIANGYFPNWKYALLATFAGLCYGWVWRKCGSMFGSALLHTAVDAIWHTLFT